MRWRLRLLGGKEGSENGGREEEEGGIVFVLCWLCCVSLHICLYDILYKGQEAGVRASVMVLTQDGCLLVMDQICVLLSGLGCITDIHGRRLRYCVIVRPMCFGSPPLQEDVQRLCIRRASGSFSLYNDRYPKEATNIALRLGVLAHVSVTAQRP